MSELVGARIEGYDIDDTLVRRELVTRFFGSVKGRFAHSLPKYTLDNLPYLDHAPQDIPGVKSQSLYWHRRRGAIEGVADRLKTKAAQGIQLIGISGRPATFEWDDMTREQLARLGIILNDVVLTPPGVSATASKADVIRTLGVTEFSDDDGKTQFYLSGLFPDRMFNWIHHGLANIPPAMEATLASRPNVRIISIKEWIKS